MSVLDMLLEIQDNQKNIEECNKLLKNNSYICSLKNMKEEFEKEKKNYKRVDQELKEIDIRFEAVSTSIKDIKKELEEQVFLLYNKTGNNLKMIDGLQSKIKNKEKFLNELEKESLELLQKEEKLVEEKENLRIRLLELKNNFYNYKEESNKKINKAKEDMKNAKTNISNLKSQIPKDILKKYTEIEYIKGTGAARLKNGICSGCKLRVSAITIDHVKKGDRIVYCDNCGRILQYNEAKNLV